MTKLAADPRRSTQREWIVAIFLVAAWFLLAANGAEAQLSPIPDVVLAQVLGVEPAEPAGCGELDEHSASVEAMSGVHRVAEQMRTHFEDQLVAGVSRPTVELEVHFGFDSDHVESESRSQIEAAAQILNQHFPGTHFRVAGFSDAQGDEGYNQHLSERRADAVWRELVHQYGVDPARLERIGYGEGDPTTGSANPQHRRVELQIVRRAGSSR